MLTHTRSTSGIEPSAAFLLCTLAGRHAGGQATGAPKSWMSYIHVGHVCPCGHMQLAPTVNPDLACGGGGRKGRGCRTPLWSGGDPAASCGSAAAGRVMAVWAARGRGDCRQGLARRKLHQLTQGQTARQPCQWQMTMAGQGAALTWSTATRELCGGSSPRRLGHCPGWQDRADGRTDLSPGQEPEMPGRPGCQCAWCVLPWPALLHCHCQSVMGLINIYVNVINKDAFTHTHIHCHTALAGGGMAASPLKIYSFAFGEVVGVLYC